MLRIDFPTEFYNFIEYKTQYLKIMKHILATLILITAFGCNNNDDANTNQRTLPLITEIGANTFGCYIDQQLFLPRDGEGTFGSEDKAMTLWGGGSNNDYNEIDVHDFKSEKTASLLLHIESLYDNGEGIYVINESNGLEGIDGFDHTYIHCRVWREDIGNYQNYLSYGNSGTINITRFDFENGIISGTFNGFVRNYQQPHDTIQIREGRFDINGYTLPDAEFD